MNINARGRHPHRPIVILAALLAVGATAARAQGHSDIPVRIFMAQHYPAFEPGLRPPEGVNAPIPRAIIFRRLPGEEPMSAVILNPADATPETLWAALSFLTGGRRGRAWKQVEDPHPDNLFTVPEVGFKAPHLPPRLRAALVKTLSELQARPEEYVRMLGPGRAVTIGDLDHYGQGEGDD